MMRRLGVALLLGYAVAMTVLAAHFAARDWILRRIINERANHGEGAGAGDFFDRMFGDFPPWMSPSRLDRIAHRAGQIDPATGLHSGILVALVYFSCVMAWSARRSSPSSSR